ncbi:MAG: SUF system NifU family Fe-S cluster assembly protein [Candidatus Margulisiibacteriota bacterium]
MNLKKLYQQVLLDHNKNPRNFKVLENATHYAHGVNPLCGDDFHLFIKINSDKIITDIGFHGTGCAISKSVSSMMTTQVINKTTEEVSQIKDEFITLLTKEITNQEAKKILGHLTLFENVKEFPIRVKCATLIWRALEAALQNKMEKKVSTE